VIAGGRPAGARGRASPHGWLASRRNLLGRISHGWPGWKKSSETGGARTGEAICLKLDSVKVFRGRNILQVGACVCVEFFLLSSTFAFVRSHTGNVYSAHIQVKLACLDVGLFDIAE
jgi:hypothetical protein